MPVRNFPGDVTVECAATMSDGTFLVVTRPTDDWTHADFHRLLGQTTGIAERVVTSVTPWMVNGATTIAFDINGSPATAYYPSYQYEGPVTLRISGLDLSLTKQSSPPAGATYLCLPASIIATR